MEVADDLAKYDPGGFSKESRDLDFSDVFGGPPRRFSMLEGRAKYSYGEMVGPENDGDSSSWGPMEEKVVFGEVRVRRHQSDDFYDDIFRGDDRYGSRGSRDRDHDRGNLFGSSPGSTIMNLPARLLPSEIEPLGALLPAEFRFSEQAIRDQDDTRNDVQPVYLQSPLSHEASSSHEDSQYNIQNSKNNTKTAYSNGNKFHFSIYKWAGKGVPVITPRLSRNSSKSKDNRRFDSASSNATMEIKRSIESLKMECEIEDSRREEEIKEPDQYSNIEEAVFGVLHSKSQNNAKEDIAFEVNHLPAFLSDEVNQPGNGTEMKGNKTVAPKEAISAASKNVEENEGTAQNKNQVDEEAQQSTNTNSPIYGTNNFSTNQKTAYSSGSGWDTKTSVENSDDHFEDNFLVQELSEDLEEVAENSDSSEDIKALDAKIRQWSSGKKGNIRSLLSTLQYVLWPGSGWKPIPLVDLIETNSVKRAYQKALLRLHPDKMQQKSAASRHKYIAEKVFDILQEAWDHFNALAPL